MLPEVENMRNLECKLGSGRHGVNGGGFWWRALSLSFLSEGQARLLLLSLWLSRFFPFSLSI